MMTNVPILQELHFQTKEEKLVVELDHFIEFLAKHKHLEDSKIKRYNIKRYFKSKSGLLEAEEQCFILFDSLIRYIIDNIDNFEVCKQTFTEIVEKLLNKTQEVPIRSTLNLYKEIVKRNFLGKVEPILKTIKIEVDDLQTLNTEHKEEFNTSDWQQISLFEYHWQKNNKDYEHLEYEDTLDKKYSYWNKLTQTSDTCKELLDKCLENIQEKQERKRSYEELKKENFENNSVRHSFSRIDLLLKNVVKDLIPTESKFKICSVNCLPSICKHQYGVHIFIEKGSLDYEEARTLIRGELENRHSLYVPEIIFLAEGTFDLYRCKNCENNSCHRFHLRDSYYTRTIGSHLELVSRQNIPSDVFTPDVIEALDNLYCLTCYKYLGEYIHKPLHWSNFSLLQEWFLSVPLQLQEMLTSAFFNHRRLRKIEQQKLEKYTTNKIFKLLQLYENGLNSLNMMYTGTLQLMNTEELIINYHSVKTVFEITSNSGASQSLKTAERWLQREADVDRTYYHACIQRHPLKYQAIGNEGPEEHNISMRECHVILFMDNLVRLRTHEDPDPGESRTSQICTLPITLKGFPHDSHVTQFWHNDNCQGNSSCECFQSINLTKDSFNMLMVPSEKEKVMMKKLKGQLQWVSSLYARDITEQLFLPQVLQSTNIDESIDQDIETLNESIRSFTFEETAETVGEDIVGTVLDIQNISEISLQEVSDSELSEFNFIEGIERLDITREDDEEPVAEYFSDDDLELPSDTEELSAFVSGQTSTLPICTVEKINPRMENNFSCEIKRFSVPPLICKHPEPATGKDDDISNLREILNDILIKLGRYPEIPRSDRILFAPDHKIAKNLLKLMKEDKQYQQFLPEFPLLHLRKSKITNLISAYKSAGIFHLLKFMKDEEDTQEWTKLLTAQNIDSATRYIRRLSLALHLAVLVQFQTTLGHDKQHSFIQSYLEGEINTLENTWGAQLQAFIEKGSETSPVFALHLDILKHCDEIVAIFVAERVGGKDGYSLLLAAVKSCLPFSFLNGASSYASFCVDLLHVYYSAGVFHQHLKETLFSTPHKESTVNLALDTQREMDHRDAIKGFRPRSTFDSVIPRMSLVDHFTAVQGVRSGLFNAHDQDRSIINESANITPDDLVIRSNDTTPTVHECCQTQIGLTQKDMKFILPVTKLVIRMGALSTTNIRPLRNIYDPQSSNLPDAILERNSIAAGEFLIKKYACQQEIFGLKKEDCPDIESVNCIKDVKTKLKSSKGTTIRLATIKKPLPLSNKEQMEKKRMAKVKKQSNIVDCLSSDMNTCQALVKPDCSKSGLQKSTGMKKALIKALSLTFHDVPSDKIEDEIESLGLILSDAKNIPSTISKNIKYAVVEFAGVKFRAPVSSGKEYLAFISHSVIGNIMRQFPSIKHIIVCEEKYMYTPDDLKAETRAKRQKGSNVSIAHLKQQDEIVNSFKFSKAAVRSTSEGKSTISTYLAKNVSSLPLKRNLILDIDSEAYQGKCQCQGACNCNSFSIPIRCTFSKDAGFENLKQLSNINQRKGEAEMAQLDWYKELQHLVSEGESVVSIVTSGDIDSIVIHLFALSHYWPRREDSSFKTPVYVLLQKAKPDLYNITEIILRLENHFGNVTKNIALSLAIGGNDFIPKYSLISHEKWITTILANPKFLQDLASYTVEERTGHISAAFINTDVYLDIVKQLYCPNTVNASSVSLHQVQQMSIKRPGKEMRNPKSWMPPESALKKMAKLVECQLDYLLTVWQHNADLPNFLEKGCLIKDADGRICYNFGHEIKVDHPNDIVEIPDEEMRTLLKTSKKRPRSNHGTPTKARKPKCRPMMSTPRKLKEK